VAGSIAGRKNIIQVRSEAIKRIRLTITRTAERLIMARNKKDSKQKGMKKAQEDVRSRKKKDEAPL